MLAIARIAVVVAAFAAATHDGAPDKDWIEGDWKVVSLQRDGAPANDDIGFVFRFTKGKAYFIDPDDPCETCEAVVALFPHQSPKEIDLKYTGPDRDDLEPGTDTICGIYRREGDRLVLCLGRGGGDPRPTEFKTAKGQEAELLGLERVK